MTKVVDPKSAAIIEAVCYWMGYQFKIERSQLIHEASLRYPIADTITSTDIAIELLELEYLHPIFKGKKIDLVIYDEGTKKAEKVMGDDKVWTFMSLNWLKRTLVSNLALNIKGYLMT